MRMTLLATNPANAVRAMLRHVALALVVLVTTAGTSHANGKEIEGTLVGVDVKDKTLSIMTASGQHTIHTNGETEFVGPKGGVSKDRLHDKRLVRGVELKIHLAADGKTAHKVHIMK